MDSGVGESEILGRFAGPNPEQSEKEAAIMKSKKQRRVRRHWIFESDPDWNFWSFLGFP
jgi:hypothetical protein